MIIIEIKIKTLGGWDLKCYICGGTYLPGRIESENGKDIEA